MNQTSIAKVDWESTAPATMPSREVDVARAPAGEPSLLAVIAAASSNPAVDIDKFERLLKMKREIETEDRERAFDADMALAQGKITAAVADKKNDSTHSKYASYAAMDAAARPHYTAHGFSVQFNTEACADTSYVKVLCRVSHRSGFARNSSVLMPADGKGAKGGDVMTKTHATGSAITYGMRALLKMAFNIPVKDKADDDGNGAGSRATEQFLSDGQIAEIEELLVKTATNRAAFLKFLAVDDLADVYANKHAKIVDMIKATAAKRQQGAANA